jgi:hypothetical protein
MNPLLRWRLTVALIGFIVWATGARAERDGQPWAMTVMTVGLVILAVAFVMRFIKPKPRVDEPPEPPPAE